MQLPLGPFGVKGGVGLPGTGECWKLEMPPELGGPLPTVFGPPPRGDIEGNSVLLFILPGLEPLGNGRCWLAVGYMLEDGWLGPPGPEIPPPG